jgi:hypothetical protein
MDSLKEHNERVLSSEYWLDPDTHSQIASSEEYDNALIELCKYYGAVDSELEELYKEEFVITHVYEATQYGIRVEFEESSFKLYAYIKSECKDEVDYLTEFSFIPYVDFDIDKFMHCVDSVEYEADALHKQVNDIVIGE